MSRGRILWIVGGAVVGLATTAALLRRFGWPLKRRSVVLEDDTLEPSENSIEAEATTDEGDQSYEKPAVTDNGTDEPRPV